MNNRPTTLHLPGHLPFPITISSLLVKPDSPIKKHEGLLVYKFLSYVSEEQDSSGEEKQVRREMVEQFDSPWEGILTEWLVKEGSVIASSSEPILSVIEPCLHEISFRDICGICGADLSIRDYTSDVSTQPNISMSHDNFDIKVTYDEAARIEKQTLKRLLTSRKLSLIVDLDQTIIHATVDPTVGEWMRDDQNPNYNAVKDVQAFQLEEGGHLGPCWYFIKIRPGLADFLEEVSRMYELHVYTMGTRAYADAVAKIVDPQRKYFGDRILSRDESGSMARKSIERLFPVDQSTVAVIDDRGDVWGWQPNLVKVIPYDFFVGIGDINSSFLPKQFTPPTPPPKFTFPKPPTPYTEEPSIPTEIPGPPESVASDTPTIDSLIAITQPDDPDLIAAQTNEQNAVLEAQQVKRPLAAAQSALDARVEANAEESESEDEELYGDKSSHKSTPPPSPHKQSLLRDNDDELGRLKGVLKVVWENFYETYKKNLEGVQREKQLVRLEGRGRNLTETVKVPDIRDIMTEMRSHVLEGTTLAFSGVIPLSVPWQTHDYTQLARQFGAEVVNDLSSSVTHVVAKNTVKVKDAIHRYPRCKIVHLNWLLMSASSWRRLDEAAFLLDDPHSDVFSPPNGLDPLDTEALLSSDEDDDEALSLPSAGVANIRGETPELEDEDEEDDVDIADVDWGDADKEVNDFLAELGEDAIYTSDESDNESVASNQSESRRNRRKRKRNGDSSREVSDADDSDNDSTPNDSAQLLRSRLAKRIHTAKSRKSQLSKAIVANNSKSSSAVASPNGSSSHGPTPVGENISGSANGSAMDRNSSSDEDAEDSDLDDWANEFEKELV